MLDIGEETYTRRLRRTDGAVEMSGDPYLADSDLVDLYAVLLNENEFRCKACEYSTPLDISLDSGNDD